MRGQLYLGHANATALFSIPVVSALETCGKKMQAPLSGLAKSIYYGQSEHGFLLHFGLESSFLLNLAYQTTWGHGQWNNIVFLEYIEIIFLA